MSTKRRWSTAAERTAAMSAGGRKGGTAGVGRCKRRDRAWYAGQGRRARLQAALAAAAVAGDCAGVYAVTVRLQHLLAAEKARAAATTGGTPPPGGEIPPAPASPRPATRRPGRIVVRGCVTTPATIDTYAVAK